VRGPAEIILASTPSCAARAAELASGLPRLVGGDAAATPMSLADAAARCERAGVEAVAVMLDPEDVPTGLSELMDAAEESRTAVLLMAGWSADPRPDPRNGAVEPLDADVAQVAAVLRGLIGRRRDLERVGHELRIASRFAGGLRGEIARMQEELQLAAQVQREFLPREFPSVGDFAVDVFWRPASYVSGDIYDVARLDERHLGVFIADAVGHGVPAALLTMVICRGLPSKDVGGGTYRIVPPSEALARINADMIAHQGRTTRFATAAYAVIDTATGRVRFASAGHPAPVLMRADGTLETVDAEGGLLGVFEGEEYAEAAFELRPGDRLLLHSDGFEQAFPGDPTGSRHARLPSKRYLDEFAAVRGAASATELAQQIGRRIDVQFGSVHQADDVTLLVVERAPVRVGA